MAASTKPKAPTTRAARAARTIPAMSLETAGSLTLHRITRESVRFGALAVASIAVATLIVLAIKQGTEIDDASAVYLVAVVIVGSVGGTWAAVGTALAAFVIYDLLFTEPRFSLAIADTTELLNLVLVLIVAIAIGRLAGLTRERAAEADRRAVEATGLFAISRLLATAENTETVASAIAERLARDAGLERVWIGLEGGSRERILADTGQGPQPNPTTILTLVRMPNDEPARWNRLVGLTRPEAVAPIGLAHAQDANLAFSLDRQEGGRATVTLGPRR